MGILSTVLVVVAVYITTVFAGIVNYAQC